MRATTEDEFMKAYEDVSTDMGRLSFSLPGSKDIERLMELRREFLSLVNIAGKNTFELDGSRKGGKR